MVLIVYSPLAEVINEYTTNENGIHISPKIESVLMNICNQVFTADKKLKRNLHISPRSSLTAVFSSPGPKVQVNYCHHLASVVCKLFTFQASSPKPLGRLEPNLAGMFLGWSSTKLLFFVLVGYSIWLPGPIMCSNWLKFQRSSSLKLMN